MEAWVAEGKGVHLGSCGIVRHGYARSRLGSGGKCVPAACSDRHKFLALSGKRGSHPDRIQIEILLIGDDLEQVPAGTERPALSADPLKCAPTASIGHGNAAGGINAIDFNVEARRWRPVAIGCSEFDAVEPSVLHINTVEQPFAGLEVVHDIAAAGGVEGGDDVDVFARPVLAPGIAFNVVVVGDA